MERKEILETEDAARNGDKDSSYALATYYRWYATIDRIYSIRKEVYWLDISLSMKDCRAIYTRYFIAKNGVDLAGDIVIWKYDGEYMFRPDPSLVSKLEKWNQEWNCPEPLPLDSELLDRKY
jgi:hypothetical protein